MPTQLRSLVIAALVVSLAGCASGSFVPSVYRIDIQQGNVIDQEQLAALEKGMEKRKVRFILGTPLVADTFNQDRWDYYYSLERRGEDRVQRVISVYFEDERLVRVGGDVLAATGPIQVETRKDELVTVPDGYRDEGLLAAITPGFLSGKPRRAGQPQAQQATAAAAPGDDAPAAADAVQVSAEDERYLREVLAGFGQDSTVDGAPAATPRSASDAAAPEQPAAEQGLLSRWARRLGLADEAADAAPTAPSPPVPAQ